MSANPDRKRIKRELRDVLKLQTMYGLGGWNATGHTDYAFTPKTRDEAEDAIKALGFTLAGAYEHQTVWDGPNHVRVSVEDTNFIRDKRLRINVLEFIG